jgi:hypothetical protein
MDEGWVGRTLSSDVTPIFKFVLPAIILISFAALGVTMLEEGVGNLLLVVIGGAFVGFLLHEYLLPLKRVVVTAHGLTVSNYRTTISIPFSEIAAVARAYKQWDIVEIGFRSETPFGRSIIFMAGARFFWLSEHPVVAFLRRRAGLDPAA